MNKGIATELQNFCETIAERYSNVKRVGNVNNESFTVEEIIPTSDHSACVNFSKTGGKVAVAFFYYINKGRSKGWKYFFPTATFKIMLLLLHFAMDCFEFWNL